MLSIILPLADRQHLGWQALQSALAQHGDPEKFEIILVLDSKARREVAGDDVALALVERCRIVSFDGDLEALQNRVRIYRRGAEQATGAFLFFMEGHTILHHGSASLLLDYLRDFPSVVCASAFPLAGSNSPVGKIMDRNQGRGAQGSFAPFAFGGQSLIARPIFLELSKIAEPQNLYGESAINDLLHERGFCVGQLPAPVCTHYNDMSRASLCHLLYFMGMSRGRLRNEGKSQKAGRWSNLLAPLRRPWIARLVYPVAASLGHMLLSVDILLENRGRRMPPGLEGTCLRLLQLSGLCRFAAGNFGAD